MSFIAQPSPAALAVKKAPLVALLTNAGSSGAAAWALPAGTFKGGAAVVDVLTCTRVSADKDGALSMSARDGLPQVLLPATALNKTDGLCASEAVAASGAARVGATGWVAALGVALGMLFA